MQYISNQRLLTINKISSLNAYEIDWDRREKSKIKLRMRHVKNGAWKSMLNEASSMKMKYNAISATNILWSKRQNAKTCESFTNNNSNNNNNNCCSFFSSWWWVLPIFRCYCWHTFNNLYLFFFSFVKSTDGNYATRTFYSIFLNVRKTHINGSWWRVISRV